MIRYNNSIIYDNIEAAGRLNLILLTKDKQTSLASAKGETLIQAHTAIRYQVDSLFIIQKEKQFALMNAKADTLLRFDYSEIKLDKDLFKVVSLDQLYGVRDMKGQVILPTKYDQIILYPTHIQVKLMDKYGIMDRKGHTILPIEYHFERLDNTLIIVQRNRIYQLFKDNQLVGDTYSNIRRIASTNYLIVQKNKKYGLNPQTNQLIMSCQYDEIEPMSTNQNDANLFLLARKEGKYGLVKYDTLKQQTQVVIPFVYDDISFVYENISYQNLYTSSYFLVLKNQLLGIIDIAGHISIPPQYKEISIITNDLFVVKQKGKSSLINCLTLDKSAWYDNIWLETDRADTLVLLRASDGKRNCILNAKGEILIPLVDEIHEEEREDIIIKQADSTKQNKEIERTTIYKVKNNGKYGLFSCDGKVLAPIEYDEFASASHYMMDKRFWRAARKGNKIGYIDHIMGKEIVPVIYDETRVQSPQLIHVVKNKKMGFVNIEGVETIDIIYDEIREEWPFNESSWYILRKGKQYVCTSPAGKLLTPLCDAIWFMDTDSSLFIRLEQGEYVGLLDASGQEIVPTKYHDICCLSPDFIGVTLNEKSGYVDYSGKIRIPLIFDSISHFENNKAIVIKDGNIGTVDMDGTFVKQESHSE